MHPLPAVVAGGRKWVLPMADASAGALAEVLLGADAAASGGPLNHVLQGDPPLAIWAVWNAYDREGSPPRSTAAAADWLVRHRFEVLNWDLSGDPSLSTRPPSPPAWDEAAEAFARRVQRNLELSLLGARLAAQRDPETAEAARLAGLCHDAAGWLAQANQQDGDEPGPPLALLPDVLRGASAESSWDEAWALVRRAEQLLAGEAEEPAALVDPAECHGRAEPGARRWAAPCRGLADWLAVLGARLGRLEQLETRFADCLEREKLDAMAEFAAGAGHEINNPLTVIAGRARLFLREETDPERRRALALMSAQAMRVYEMIADMRLFARPPRPEPQSFDLQELLARLVEEYAERAAHQAIRLSRAGLSEPLLVEADPVQLHVALSALCRNALEAIGAEGHVELWLGAEGGSVQIRVSDDGPGIAAKERRHLFDPFYSARQAGRGLGLGLSKAWRIVQSHGGRIDVESRPGHGAALTITLPRRYAGQAPE